MVVLLIMVNLLAFLYELNLGRDSRILIRDFGMIPYHITHNNPGSSPVQPVWLTLITSQFLHGGWLHLGGNMLFLWVFGDEIEGMLGSFGFLMFYLAGGCVAGMTQAYVAPDSSIPTIGASGAIAAVLGAYIVTYPGARVMTLVGFFFLNLPAWIVLGLWAVIQAFQGVASIQGAGEASSNVAVWAHVGGFVFGAIMIVLVSAMSGSTRPPQPDPQYPFYNRRAPWREYE